MGTYDYVVLKFICNGKVSISSLKKLLMGMQKKGFSYHKGLGYISKKREIYVTGKSLETDIENSSLKQFGFYFNYKSLGFTIRYHEQDDERLPELSINLSVGLYWDVDKARLRINETWEIFAFVVENFSDFILFGCGDFQHFTHEMDYFFMKDERKSVEESVANWCKQLRKGFFWLAYIRDELTGKLRFDISKETFISKAKISNGWIIQAKPDPEFLGAVLWQ